MTGMARANQSQDDRLNSSQVAPESRHRVGAVRLRNVRLEYPGPPPVIALDGVDLDVDAGEFVAILGPSGAGKSSLLHTLGLLTTPTSGTVELAGQEIRDTRERDLDRLRGDGVGFVFQAFHLMEGRTVEENVALPLRYQRVHSGEARERAAAAIEKVGLSHRIDATARTLSGGERQRVAIARALVTNPAVLLCDEPTGNLDSRNSANIMELLHDLHARGHTIIVITHDEHLAAQIPRTVRLLDGRVLSGTDPTAEGPSAVSGGKSKFVRQIASVSDTHDGRGGGKLRLVDLLDEALAVLFERGWRTLLTCLGTVLGVGTLVAVLGLTSTASTQISRQFDRLTATTVTAQSFNARAYAPAQLDRARELNGVRGLAYLQPIDAAEVDSGPTSPEAVAAQSLPVVAANPDAWSVITPTLVWGRTFDASIAGQRVAVLGSAAARQAGIYGPLGTQSILISGHPYLVIGVFDDVQRRTDLLLSIVIPTSAATADWGNLVPSRNSAIVVSTAVGAGRQVAQELPLALAPENPDTLDVTPPPDPRQLRDSVSLDLTDLFLMLASVTLLVGMVGIANTTLVSVIERIPEIGLRRALGARRVAIRTQFLTESVMIGAVGGLIGSLLGLICIMAVAVAHDWTPVLPRLVILVAPVGGAVAGALAGYLPAQRAARTDPTVALRQ